MSSGALPSVGAVPRHDSDNASHYSLGCLSTQAGQRRCDRGRPHLSAVVSKWCQKRPVRSPGASCSIGFMLICRNITSRGGGTRTHTPSQDPDFKSGASADSATPPGFGREYSSYSFVSSALQQRSSG